MQPITREVKIREFIDDLGEGGTSSAGFEYLSQALERHDRFRFVSPLDGKNIIPKPSN